MRKTLEPLAFVSEMIVSCGVALREKRGSCPVMDLLPWGGYLQIDTAANASSIVLFRDFDERTM